VIGTGSLYRSAVSKRYKKLKVMQVAEALKADS